MLRAGSLNRTVRIERRAPRDPNHEGLRWETVMTVPANIRMLSGKEVMAANANVSMGTASIRIRYRTDVKAGMRVVHGDAAFHITAVLPDYARREHVDLTCETDDIH
ncbi:MULTISPECIES: phage head closure protein [unclassified Caballeronia]|uniref:phage head closure protein n=1 Tax=unclassified Caballeronia TaxID=2646786 RepID=UPI002860BE9E|nr:MULTISPECIES: phage head closure protein [unclassified Caballeronia]MDR5777758.1 phage head closure protein [Caballeronia sp. LZ002]MDR5803467.1 phage head closure protein [Caballeronia sp. LZ001]MDR5852135.1 phage head closure protein [Caballeronia sp. LZ003]